MPGKLTNGNPTGKGGKRPGAGRPPEWLRDKCREIIDRQELIDFVGNVAAGLPFKAMIGSTEMKVSADVKERLKAVEMLKEWGFGKAAQPLTGADDGPLIVERVFFGESPRPI
jgi:hypothetical protein